MQTIRHNQSPFGRQPIYLEWNTKHKLRICWLMVVRKRFRNLYVHIVNVATSSAEFKWNDDVSPFIGLVHGFGVWRRKRSFCRRNFNLFCRFQSSILLSHEDTHTHECYSTVHSSRPTLLREQSLIKMCMWSTLKMVELHFNSFTPFSKCNTPDSGVLSWLLELHTLSFAVFEHLAEPTKGNYHLPITRSKAICTHKISYTNGIMNAQ